MITFIIGPNDSGKSSYAESLIEQGTNRRYYIATMIPYGSEGEARVKKHIKMREHLNMITIEDPYLTRTDEIDAGADVLLEDLSNLIANRMFDKGDVASIIYELTILAKKVNNLIIVSIGGIEVKGYDEATSAYITALNNINLELETIADKTVRMGE